MKKYERTVFGRIKGELNGKGYVVEMKKDGIHVRRKHCQSEWILPLDRLLNHAQHQPELVWDDRKQPEFFSDNTQSTSIRICPESHLDTATPLK